MRKIPTQVILSAATATGAGSIFEPFGSRRTFQIYGTTTAGAGAATVKIQVSNVPDATSSSQWEDLIVFNLILGTSAVSDRFASNEPWRYIRANVTAISGTNASVNVIFGNDLEG